MKSRWSNCQKMIGLQLTVCAAPPESFIHLNLQGVRVRVRVGEIEGEGAKGSQVWKRAKGDRTIKVDI